MAALTEERPSTEERVSYIEGALPHLATKADIAEVMKELAELRAEMAKSETRLLRWGVTALSIAIAAIAVLIRLMG